MIRTFKGGSKMKAVWILAIAVILICIAIFAGGMMRMVTEREPGAKTKRQLIIPVVTIILTITLTGIVT